jgi:hypothetical protein
VGIWDFLGKTVETMGTIAIRHQVAKDLMDMSEASGMVHLGVLVPQIVEEDWMGEFILRLEQFEDGLYDATPADQEKAKNFRVHAQLLAAREGWRAS